MTQGRDNRALAARHGERAAAAPTAPPPADCTITVAVAGNPNAGKSTLINAIARTRLQVGNWPGGA